MDDRQFAGLSYEQAVRRYQQTVAGVCVMRLQNWADAEDCFQNTFVKLYCRAPHFSDENHLKAWLIKVAVNECKNYIRKYRRSVPLDQTASQQVVFNEDSSDISWALMKTPLQYREVLYLFYCEEYRVKEIAYLLHLKENTVKTRLKRGREKLRAIYGGDEA